MFTDDFFKNIDEEHKRKREAFEKLRCEPCLKEVQVGDRVLIPAGVVNRGHDWIILEGKVLEVAEMAYSIEFKDRGLCGKPDITWVHRFCIMDVLERPSK